VPPSPYPPYDYQCLYRDHCPHLEGLSTHWVLTEYQQAHEVYQEHLQIIDHLDGLLKTRDQRIRGLERENAELKAKLQALHRRQFKSNKKPNTESKDPKINPLTEEKKKRGAPVGHPGWMRPKPDHIDQIVLVPAPTTCPHCQSDQLTWMKETTEHLQEDIVLQPKTVVTRYLHGQAFCARCNRPVIQPGENELVHAPIGPVAKSAAVYLRYRMGIPYRKVTTLFRELFGLTFVPASALGFDRKAAVRGRSLYEDLREKIRASDKLHADETSWRNDGLNHYVWYAGNEDLAFFHLDRHRSAEVAQTIFGKDFQGTLIRDRYAAYNGISLNWQACLAHIITATKEIKREHGLLPDSEQDPHVDSFAGGVKDLCSKACDIGQKLKSDDLSFSSAKRFENQFLKTLTGLCRQSLGFKPAETLRKFLIGPEQKNLFTFLRVPGVPPTNNQAEQSLRYLVIFRKVCFGTRSQSGLLTHSILPSLVHTARRQGVHPREFLQTLLTADTASAQKALYNNSR
jgi:transposase